MGSVSSLISGHSFHSKHCRASQYKLRKSSHLKKLNRYSDGLLRFGFSQESGHKSGSKSSKNEDFFYIKVSQKAPGPHRTDYTALGSTELGQAGSSGVDFGTPTPQKLMPFPSQREVVRRGDGALNTWLPALWGAWGGHLWGLRRCFGGQKGWWWVYADGLCASPRVWRSPRHDPPPSSQYCPAPVPSSTHPQRMELTSPHSFTPWTKARSRS